MKTIVVYLLAASLTANAWLLFRPTLRPMEGPTDAARAAAPAAGRVKPSADSMSKTSTDLARLLAAIEPSDLAGTRDALRAAGVDETSIRGVLEGMLRRRAFEQSSAAALEGLRGGWWGRRAAGGGGSLRQLVHEPLHELLGRDPLELADVEVRYDFLPPEKRRLLANIDLDYGELEARAMQSRANAPLRAEIEEQQLLARERRKDILAALSPEERAEYDLRFSGSAAQNGRRFAALQVTEQEFRAIKPIVDVFAEQQMTIAGGPLSPAFGELQQRTVDRLVEALGYERAVEYLWGGDSGPYASTANALREANLPPQHAAHLLQLAADAGVQARAIHEDASLTADQKRAALLALQQAMRPRFETFAPPVVQGKLPEEATGWFALLGEGRYKRYAPLLVGSGWMVPPVASVASPPSGPKIAVPLPRKPGG